MALSHPKITFLFTCGLVAMLLQTIHCRPIRSVSNGPKVALLVTHIGKHVVVNEDGSLEATGSDKDITAHFYLDRRSTFNITLESVQNEGQFLLVNEAGNLTVAPLGLLEEESGSADSDYVSTYLWKLKPSPSLQGIIALATSVNGTDCFIAFDESGQALPPCSSGLTEDSLEARIEIHAVSMI